MDWMVSGWVRYRTPLTVLINTWLPLPPAVVGENHRVRIKKPALTTSVDLAVQSACVPSRYSHIWYRMSVTFQMTIPTLFYQNKLFALCLSRGRGHLRLHTAGATTRYNGCGEVWPGPKWPTTIMPNTDTTMPQCVPQSADCSRAPMCCKMPAHILSCFVYPPLSQIVCISFSLCSVPAALSTGAKPTF